MSVQRVDSAEGLPIPNHLHPEQATGMFPHLNAHDLGELKRAGWARVGVAAAIVDEDQRVLMLEHRGSDKTLDGALGPLAETGQLAWDANGRIVVESAGHTFSRGIREELGVENPADLQLTAKPVGSWVLNSWPVGVNYADQDAFAVCPVVHIDREAKERLLDTFNGSEEIKGVAFMTRGAIESCGLVRPGTHTWVRDVMGNGLHMLRPHERVSVEFPDSSPLSGAVDIKFDKINI